MGESIEVQGGIQITMTSKVPFSDYVIHSLKVTKVWSVATNREIIMIFIDCFSLCFINLTLTLSIFRCVDICYNSCNYLN